MFAFFAGFLISSVQLDGLTEKERTIEENEIYDLILAQTTLVDSSYTEIGKGEEKSDHRIDYLLGATIVPDSLFKLYLPEILTDFKSANNDLTDSLKLNTTYFSSEHSKKTAKILFSHCGFSKNRKYAFIYFEDWTPYYYMQDVEVMTGEGAFAFLNKQDGKWRLMNIGYFWTAN
ncbi:MAG: hypothetical protein ACI8ZM_003637 [Crocinitomix sp.]|jgi:hypothetical protein